MRKRCETNRREKKVPIKLVALILNLVDRISSWFSQNDFKTKKTFILRRFYCSKFCDHNLYSYYYYSTHHTESMSARMICNECVCTASSEVQLSYLDIN